MSVLERAPLSILEPGGDPRGGIVVVQEAFGVTGHITDVARRFADDGWLAVAPHLFHRTGDPRLGYDDLDQVKPHMTALTTEGVRYPDAGHGFHNDQRPAYHPESAHDAWRRTLEWFDRHLSN